MAQTIWPMSTAAPVTGPVDLQNIEIAPQSDMSRMTFMAGGDEMLRLEPDGFYVRGHRVPVDEHEAMTVYKSFREWLAWNRLQQGR